MELDGYDFARLLGLDEPIDPREWRLETAPSGGYFIIRILDGQRSRGWGKSDVFHDALVRFLRTNGVTDCQC